MSTLSAERIEKYLKEYSLGIDLWDSEAGDTFLLLSARELLQESIKELSAEQLAVLDKADFKAKSTLKGYRGPETFDALMLKDIVSVVESVSTRKAA